MNFVEADRFFYRKNPHKKLNSSSYNETEATTPILPLSQIDVDANPAFTRKIQTKEVPWNLAVVAAQAKLDTPVPDDILTYDYMRPSGAGVKIYVFDSGIAIHNPAFGGRAINLWDVSCLRSSCRLL